MNLPVLGGTIHSYEQQIRSAFRRAGPSQPQSPDRGLAGQLFRPLVRRQPAFQPGREALVSAGPSPTDHARMDGCGCGSRLHGSLQLGKLRSRPP